MRGLLDIPIHLSRCWAILPTARSCWHTGQFAKGMVVLGVPLFIGLEFGAAADEDALVAEGLFGGETYDEEFCVFLLLLLVALVVVVVFARGKRIILIFFFLRMGLGGGTVVMGVEVEVMQAPPALPVLRAIFSDMWTCRTASLMML